MTTIEQKTCSECGEVFHVEPGSALIVCAECRGNPEQVLNYSNTKVYLASGWIKSGDTVVIDTTFNEPPRFVADAVRQSMPAVKRVMQEAIDRSLSDVLSGRRLTKLHAKRLKNDQ